MHSVILFHLNIRFSYDHELFISRACHYQLSFWERPIESPIPWRACPAQIPIWRGAMHCLQAVWSCMPCSGEASFFQLFPSFPTCAALINSFQNIAKFSAKSISFLATGCILQMKIVRWVKELPSNGPSGFSMAAPSFLFCMMEDIFLAAGRN